MDVNNSTVVKAVTWCYWQNAKVLCVRSRDSNKFYIPGGKPEDGETDIEALRREIREELNVTLLQKSIRELTTIRAPAHGYPPAVSVEMKCFASGYAGCLEAHSEIEELTWIGFGERNKCAPAARLAIEHLAQEGHLDVGRRQ